MWFRTTIDYKIIFKWFFFFEKTSGQQRKLFSVVPKNRILSLNVVDRIYTSNLNQHEGIEAEFTSKMPINSWYQLRIANIRIIQFTRTKINNKKFLLLNKKCITKGSIHLINSQIINWILEKFCVLHTSTFKACTSE